MSEMSHITQNYYFYEGSQKVDHIEKQELTYNFYGTKPGKAVMEGPEEMFERMTREAIANFPDNWKEILKPYKSAVDAGAMDQIYNCQQFNEKFGILVDSSAFSRWMNGSNESYRYKMQENGRLISLFEALKCQSMKG